jgi:tRNA pseudouridine38-40 synthase
MRIALGIEYNGYDFYGWQNQVNLITVQGTLENALGTIADKPIRLFCAGRTDAGVNATGQVVHFDTSVIRNERAWTLGVNTHLPATIAVRWMREVDNTFHARFSALARCYRYVIYNSSLRSAITATHATWHHHLLNAELMQQGSQYLLGEQNFTSFRSSQCESKSPMRDVHYIKINRLGEFVIIEIKANAFLHHMVRNIVGVLMKVGAGFQKPEWVQEVLLAKDRCAAANTAPPTGLYLYQVDYPPQYQLPVRNDENTTNLLLTNHQKYRSGPSEYI